MAAASSTTLPPTTDSVPHARRFARSTLETSSADVDTVLLLVSEVVTNAVLHARSAIVLTVGDLDGVVRVEVQDESPMLPRMHRFRLASATGRGLRLLEQLSMAWGVEPVVGSGKIVWFEVGAADESVWDTFADDMLTGEV